ncbi:hypothetical protein [Segetibacter koreensis]|uniref:hypothetical protein n=1 Tax=Segetibacter koreensis TaxID=398037 RepID=UPI000363D19F|nr:hypothetical protein [Segetibacter koreensis]
MGFEIKNICTVVPNPHHPAYRSKKEDDKNYYYFSVFITPKLQFDGSLKEFYEILHWPEYAEKLFYPIQYTNYGEAEICDNVFDTLEFVQLIRNNNDEFPLKKDYSFIEDLISKMNNSKRIDLDKPQLLKFLKQSKEVWKKLFHENVPVEAWPIYLKPQIQKIDTQKIKDLTDEISSLRKQIKNVTTKIEELPMTGNDKTLIHDNLVNGIIVNTNDFNFTGEQNNVIQQLNGLLKKQKDVKAELNKVKESNKRKINEKIKSSKYRQEFHKKISVLARYPHILRVLGLIQDFKILKNDLPDPDGKLLKLNIDTAPLINKKQNENYPFDEFRKSVQFVQPFTKCEVVKQRLRAYYIQPQDDPTGKADYRQYVTDGFLNTHFLNEEEKPVFEVDQDYFEDRTQDFGKINQPNPTNNKEETTKVVGINKKVFTDEEIEILKQKVNNKPRISKGFSIKVHSQPGSLLTSMDEKLKELTDDNIESEESAFMAHHLDCGYRVDVNVITVGENKKLIKQSKFHSLCLRQAKYVIDRKKDNIHIPIVNKNIPLHDENLFTQLIDEPWLEEVRLINSDGSEDRFEEIARWNGWSLTCPPLHNNNNSAENSERDDLELREIKPFHLPKLRFGENYQYHFRIRTVDICGNGPHLNTGNDFPQECIFKASNYEREEGIGAPLFFPTYEIVKDINDKKAKNKDKKIKEQYKGEDNETLVIRSKVDKSGEVTPVNDECVRYITPPYVTMHFAELSGTLDILFENATNPSEVKRFYELLAAEPKHYYAKEDIEHSPIPFLVDKDIDKILVKWEYHNQEFNNQFDFNYKNPNDLLSLLPLKLKLQKASDSNLSISQNNNIVTTAFNPGFYRYYTIQSLSRTNQEPSGTKSFTVIHAVQRPIFLNENQKLLFIKINEEELISNLLGAFCFEKKTPLPDSYKEDQKYQVSFNENLVKDEVSLFPFSTTAEIIITAEYNEFELNPFNKEGWSFISKSHPKEKKESESTSTTSPCKADKFILRKSWSNLNNKEDDDKFATIIADDVEKDKIINEFDSFKHSFPDTKFRKVNYKLEAVSKFAELFDMEHHQIDKKDPFSVFASLDKEFDGKDYYTIIANSAKPSKPNITSIVPIFTITDPDKNNGNTYTFEHKTFRIYLGNTWYETGLEEKIAVIHERTASTLQYDKDGNPLLGMKKDSPNELLDSSYIKRKISIFANDPTDPILSKTDSVINNNMEYIGKTVGSDNTHADSLNTFLFENTVENPSDIPIAEQHKNHVFSLFDVNWDTVQKQFYCDIILNEKAITAYTYLLKFAICRYQKNSIFLENTYDYRFSDVVMTDMVSILPNRNISKVPNQKDKYILTGRKGGRYIFKDGNYKTPVLNSNKVYLISEDKNPSDDNITKINERKPDIKPIDFDSDIQIDTKKYKAHFIEEYEDVPLNNDFYIDDNLSTNPTYNPRNDPRKRLVFFYKIK